MGDANELSLLFLMALKESIKLFLRFFLKTMTVKEGSLARLAQKYIKQQMFWIHISLLPASLGTRQTDIYVRSCMGHRDV